MPAPRFRELEKARCKSLLRLCLKASSQLCLVDPASSRCVEAVKSTDSHRLPNRLGLLIKREVASAEYWRKPFQSAPASTVLPSFG